jgi:hypothetical protein
MSLSELFSLFFYKVGFITEKEKATASEVQQSLEASSSVSFS